MEAIIIYKPFQTGFYMITTSIMKGLILKDSSTHMHGLTNYVKERLPFVQDSSLENSAGSYSCFWLALLHRSLSVLVLFPLWITYFVFVHSFWFYFIIDEVYLFRWNWHRLCGLCYNFSTSNDLTQMVNFPTQIPDCDPPALLDLILPSDASICSTMALSPLVNSDHVGVSVSIDFP